MRPGIQTRAGTDKLNLFFMWPNCSRRFSLSQIQLERSQRWTELILQLPKLNCEMMPFLLYSQPVSQLIP